MIGRGARKSLSDWSVGSALVPKVRAWRVCALTLSDPSPTGVRSDKDVPRFSQMSLTASLGAAEGTRETIPSLVSLGLPCSPHGLPPF